MKFWSEIELRLKKLKYKILYPLNVFENEVADIRMSNENIKRYRIQHLRKAFFSISIKQKDDVFKYLFYLLTLVLLFLLPIAGFLNGISEKEIQQQQRAELLYEYYANDNPAILSVTNADTHTQFVDFMCFCVTKWLHINSIYDFRHIVGALFAWMIFIVIGSFLMNLFSWRAAFFGGIFLILSPHFLGQAFGNVADISFAFFYIFAIYQIYILIGELPIVKWKRLVFIVLSIAAANSVHVGGFVLLHYMYIGVIIAFILANPIKKIFSKKYVSNLGKLLLIMLGMTAVVYILYLLYPLHGFRSIAVVPRDSILKMAENQPITEILWGGKRLSTHDLSIGFVLQRMQFTVPLLIIIGALVHLIVIRVLVKKIHLANSILLLFGLLFPLLTLKGVECEIYDGWAIYLMIYPLIVMFAMAGYEGLLRKVDDKYTNFVIISIILLLCCMPLRHILVHYQTVGVYFNELSGGITTSYGKYTIDEGENANRPACIWLMHNAVPSNDSTKIRVCTDGNQGCDYYLRHKTEQFELTHGDFNTTDSLSWDYFICFVDSAKPEELLNQKWISMKSIHRIYVENKPIAIILHREPELVVFPEDTELSEEDTLNIGDETAESRQLTK